MRWKSKKNQKEMMQTELEYEVQYNKMSQRIIEEVRKMKELIVIRNLAKANIMVESDVHVNHIYTFIVYINMYIYQWYRLITDLDK